MTPHEIQKAIERISWGYRFEGVKNGLGETKIVVLRPLSLEDRGWVDFIYNQALADGSEQGLLKESDLLLYYNKIGAWTNAQEKQYKELKEDVEKLKDASDSQGEMTNSEFKKTKALYRAAQNTFEKMLDKRDRLFSMSLDRFAEEQKVSAIVFSSVYSRSGKRYWETWEDFENEVDRTFVKNLTSSVFNRNVLTEKQIRKIARSPLWRFKWTGAQKTGEGVFGKPVTYLDAEQEALLYWSQVYDSAYDAYERPSEEIINDDEALDNWFKEQSKKQKSKQISKGKSGSSMGISQRVGKHAEVFVVANRNVNPDAPEMSEIWDLNSDGNKRFIKMERNKLKTHGVVKEQQMRPDRNTRMLAGAQRAEFEIRRGKKHVNKLHDY